MHWLAISRQLMLFLHSYFRMVPLLKIALNTLKILVNPSYEAGEQVRMSLTSLQ